MSTAPAPLVTPPIRPAMTSLNNRVGGARNPRLALAIPGAAPTQPAPSRPGLPQLRLATPAQGTNLMDIGRRASQTTNQYVALGFAMGLKTQVQGSPDNTTGGASKEASRPRSDVDQSTLDVEDLDDAGWRIAREKERIVELGSLGEGAGGAVTKCQLKGGKTLFAMKVRSIYEHFLCMRNTNFFLADHHNRPK